jgi:hypothetical protein
MLKRVLKQMKKTKNQKPKTKNQNSNGKTEVKRYDRPPQLESSQGKVLG